MDRWIPFFAKLGANMANIRYSGNHDYGDYGQWESKGHQKQANLEQLKICTPAKSVSNYC